MQSRPRNARHARLVLADHQVLFRESLAHHLRQEGYTVVCEVEDGDSLRRCLLDHQPDILVLERHLPRLDTFEYCRALVERQPDLQILLLVAYAAEAEALQMEALLAGAAGCLSKDLDATAYLLAVQHLQDGLMLFRSSLVRRAVRLSSAYEPDGRLHALTRRELEILELVADGLANQDIAERLGISPHTVMKHVSNIITKLGVGNRMEAGLLLLRSRDH